MKKKSNLKKYYLRDKKKYKNQAKSWRKNNKKKVKIINKNYLQKLKLLIYEKYCNGKPKCACCGETQVEFMSIDHKNGGGREHRRKAGPGIGFYRWIIENDFPDSLQILCYNCNLAKGFLGKCPHKMKKR